MDTESDGDTTSEEIKEPPEETIIREIHDLATRTVEELVSLLDSNERI